MAKQLSFTGVYLAGKPQGTLWDIYCNGDNIATIREHKETLHATRDGRFLTPSLCHPHIHLDKCFLLSHPKYSDLKIEEGDFAKALALTIAEKRWPGSRSVGHSRRNRTVLKFSDCQSFVISSPCNTVMSVTRCAKFQGLTSGQGQAKERFEFDDLMERGEALIEESIEFGVTHMRAFVEVDQIVGMKCLDAGLALKEKFGNKCHVQICAFAQDPIYSQDDGGRQMVQLIEEAAARKGVDVIGSTPYVEKTLGNQHANINWMISLALKHSLHLDFHLDYNLDAKKEPSVHHVIQELRKANWRSQKAVTLGHCTRLTLFTSTEWQELRSQIGELPIFFIGLPTSDLFMMGRPDVQSGGGERFRGTLQIPQMIERYGIQAAVGVNNVGNAFTPHGNCDPLSVATLGVGIYQSGTKADAEILLQCVSTRAKAAIGLGLKAYLELKEGDRADLVAFGTASGAQNRGFRQRRTATELVHDSCHDRMTVFSGEEVSGWR